MSDPDVRVVSDFALRDGEPPVRHCFSSPVRVLQADSLKAVLPTLRTVEEEVKKGHWAFGFVAYEAAPAFDPAMVVRDPVDGLPLAWFALFDAPNAEMPDIQERSEMISPSFSSDMSIGRWTEAVAHVQDAIAHGETYQVNLTRRLRATLPASVSLFGFYERLRRAQTGARYTAFLDTGRFQIMTISPELFFAVQGDQLITRPMKGTARRGRWNQEDACRAEELAHSEKERAENVMIVDLLRNDLGRVSEPGSVTVSNLFAIETYPTVLQMTSTITAQKRGDVRLAELFGALFPCGSVTGAPKIQTMRHITVLEPSPRGVYCGAIGMVQPGGDAVFNVAIRTLTLDRETRTLEYGVGSGITWDSRADTEWAETRAKSALLSASYPAFDLLETLRLENGQFVLRERHLSRLMDSARYFRYSCDHALVESALDAFAAEHPVGVWRVRLRVTDTENPRIEGTPFDTLWGTLERPLESIRCMLAEEPVVREDVFLYHKTTHRAVYEKRRQKLPPGAFDVLLWNEEGQVTEFCLGNLVAEMNGNLWTPPRECGLLSGTFREELLLQGTIRERILTIADLQQTRQLYFINSVRGWVPVVLE